MIKIFKLSGHITKEDDSEFTDDEYVDVFVEFIDFIESKNLTFVGGTEILNKDGK